MSLAFVYKLFDKTMTLDNINVAYLLFDFSFYNFIYFLLPDYLAYVITYAFGLVVGYFSFYSALYIYNDKIQHDNRSSKALISLVSLCFALIPVEPIYKIAVSVLPVYFISAYMITVVKNKIWLTSFVILPFFSYFSGTLLYVIGIYLMYIIFISIYKRKIYLLNYIAFILLCFSTVLCNIRLFFLRFVDNQVLNRDAFSMEISGDGLFGKII